MPAHSATGPEIERLIQLLAKLPGLGPRSARRAALHLVKKKESLLAPLSAAMSTALDSILVCSTCGNIDTSNPCAVCTDPRRDPSVIVVVEDVADLWALERAAAINARYHVLGGVLSALDGIGPDELNVASLIERAGDGTVKEIIFAVNATVEGQTTAPLCHRPTGRRRRDHFQARPWSTGRRRIGLSRRGHLVGGRPPAHQALSRPAGRQTGKPCCWAISLSGVSGRAPIWVMTSAAARPPNSQQTA